MADIDDLTQNVTIWDNAKGKNVTVSTDGAKERLDCNIDGSTVVVSDSESATKYQMKTDFHAAADADALNTSTDVVLTSVTGTGTLDFVAIAGSTSNYEIAIEVDGTERIRITMAELSQIGLSNATNVPFWAETANKNFRYSPNIPVGYTTGWRILAKATTTPTPSVTHLALYRERIT